MPNLKQIKTKIGGIFTQYFARQRQETFLFYGENIVFSEGVYVDRPDKVVIKNNVCLGKNVEIRGRGGVSIGDNTVVALNTIILSANHNYKTGIPFGDDYILKSTTIGKGCWIGAGCIILPGVTVGDNVVIGAGTIVNQDIPDNAIACNETKIKIIKYRENAQ